VQIGYFHASNGMQCEGCLGPVVAELPAKDSLLSSLAVFSGKQKDIAELERMMKL